MLRKTAGVGAALALVASMLFTATPAQASEKLASGGSSFAGNIMQTCAAAYTKNSVTYASVGSGTGRRNFLNGTYDFGASDSAYLATDAKPANFTYVPLLGGPIAFAYNVNGLNNLRLTPTVISDIFKGNITLWNDPAIKKLNPKATLPAETIKVVFRSDNSGTTQNLSNYLSGSGAVGWTDSGAWATAVGATRPVGVGAAQNQGVVAELQKTPYSFGYADLADVRAKLLSFAAVKNGAGQFVKPSVIAATRFLSVQKVTAEGLVTFNYKAKVKGGYNATLIAYGLAPTANGTAKAAAIKDFFKYVINTCSPSKSPAKGYLAISGALKTTALRLVEKIK